MRLLTALEKHERRIGKSKGVKALIRRMKAGPCMDCGKSYPPHVMDFDHVPSRGTKLFELSKCGGEWAFGDVEREIFKCDLVCSNCHRLRTHERKASKERGALSVDVRPRLVRR